MGDVNCKLEVTKGLGVLRAAISNEVKYGCSCMCPDCDKQIIAGIINPAIQCRQKFTVTVDQFHSSL